MKVFISWSGPLAKNVAEKLRTWLRKVIQVIEPFVSTQDIAKGDVWLIELLQQLEQSAVGIICLTRDNLHADWIQFESGALVRQMGRARLCILLIDVSPLELTPPLSAFQATTFKRDDVFRLIRTIHSALERPLLTENELNEQFTTHWPELEAHLRDALAAPVEHRSDIQALAQELLLPVIYREAVYGDLDTVFHWLDIAKRRKVASLESQLAFIEAALARLTGKRGAGHSLRSQSAKGTELGFLAQLEYCYLQFAAGRSLHELPFDASSLDRFPNAARRTAHALFGLWHMREGRDDEGRRCLDMAQPDVFSGDIDEHYRALPLGILCFALGEGKHGERQFDLVKTGPGMLYEGYPFVSLLSEFDKAFVGASIGFRAGELAEKRIREFKGHGWVLVKYAEFMRRNSKALETLVGMSAGWRNPLTAKGVSDRLTQFERRLLAGSGAPLLT